MWMENAACCVTGLYYYFFFQVNEAVQFHQVWVPAVQIMHSHPLPVKLLRTRNLSLNLWLLATYGVLVLMCVQVAAANLIFCKCFSYNLCLFNSSAAGDWVNCGICGEWAHFGCDRRQGLGAFKVLHHLQLYVKNLNVIQCKTTMYPLCL